MIDSTKNSRVISGSSLRINGESSYLKESAINTAALAVFFKAAGDPLRLDILRVLQYNAYGVLELGEIFETKQSGMSHHLKVLANAGLVVSRREGNTIFYRRSPLPLKSAMLELHRNLFLTIDSTEIAFDLIQRIKLVNLERTKASREFFEQNTGKFNANQDLIASYKQYGQIITEFLDSTSIKKGTVLEVGPGEGEFLIDLAKRFKRVVGIDTSKEMINISKKTIASKGLFNVELLHGDTGLAIEEKIVADCITLNMVLHHTPDPAAVFGDISRLLTEKGVLIVTELCGHDQTWAHKSCGDLWLGFEPDDLKNWAAAAELCEGESLYLAQRNGFQIQLHQFFKKKSRH